MEKRVLIAVTLSIAVILVYPMVLAKINPNLSSSIQKPQVVAKQAVADSGKHIPIEAVIIGINGDVLQKVLLN